MDPDGDFVVAWTTRFETGYGIYARRYDAAGAPLGDELRVDQATRHQSVTSVASDGAGGFAVAWVGYGVAPADADSGVFLRRFGPNGVPLGEEVHVSPEGIASPADVQVLAGSGDLVVVWSNFRGAGADGYQAVVGRRFDPAGQPVGEEFEVAPDVPRLLRLAGSGERL
jgi:hypothetical protein